MSDEASMHTILILLDIFRKCSGLKINRDKSEAIWIGASSNFTHKPEGLKWTSEMVRCLGVSMNANMDTVIEFNFKEKIKKLENLIQMWAARPLTLKGKITVIQTIFMSQMLYPCSSLYVPDWVIDHIHNLFEKFLWKSKKPQIKHLTMIADTEFGGLRFPNFKTK